MKPAALAAVLCMLAGCSTPQAPTEYDLVLKRPRPANEEARQQECAWLDTSLARQKKLASYVAATSTYPSSAVAYQDAAQRNMAVLHTRSREINCQTAAATAPFEQCFARCTQYTDRGKEQCFDACNR